MISDVGRGFCFMPEIKFEESGLQYVEDSELKQAWKSTWRERLKLQEQKIWQEFIQEQDIVQNVCENDPYQFIEELPENYLQEFLSKSLSKKGENDTSDDTNEEQWDQTPEAIDLDQVLDDRIHSDVKDNQNVFSIYHEENDNEELSSTECEVLDESVSSPCTVREKEEVDKPKEPPHLVTEKMSSKSSENIASVIENSIYCAKVKDLRVKINEELLSIITSLKRLSLDEDPEDLKKMLKRSAEFCSRFNRIHLYQLQRQVKDVERGNGSGGSIIGAGRHTQLQAQLLRLTSLHHNILQALSALHKCVRQGGCDAARGARDVTALLRSLEAPQRADTLYDAELLATCDKLDLALEEHNIRIEEVVRSLERLESNPYSAKTTTSKQKKRMPVSGNKPSNRVSRADGKLSMYSLDTLKINLKPKNSITRENPSSSSTKVKSTAKKTQEKQQAVKKLVTPKSRRKSPIKKRVRESEVRTMVQTVETCASSQVSLIKTSLKRTEQPKRKAVNTSDGEVTNRMVTSARSPLDTGRRSTATTHQERSPKVTPRKQTHPEDAAVSCDVTKLLKELCGGDSARKKMERVSGANNAQLHCVSSTSPQTPTMPQILRILEETIQKKSPRSPTTKHTTAKAAEKYRMAFNISDKTVDDMMQYRTKFVQHMLTSTMYANSSVDKPWEMVNCVSEKIIDELLLNCAKEMQLHNVVRQMYQCESQ